LIITSRLAHQEPLLKFWHAMLTDIFIIKGLAL